MTDISGGAARGTPTGDGPPLSSWTLTWLAEGPPAARTLVHRVWKHPHRAATIRAPPRPRRAERAADPVARPPALPHRPLPHLPSPPQPPLVERATPLFPCPRWITIDFRLHEPLRGSRWPAPSQVVPDDGREI